MQYPHRNGWHTDQSYRRPPPDISLFFAVTPVARERGQTLFADGTAAYAALPPPLKAKVERLQGLHASRAPARSRRRRAGRPHADASSRRTSARSASPSCARHPVTGKPALYLCEWGQMDWLDGPFVGMQPGPHGDGAALLDELMAHYTRPEFVYVHEWTGATWWCGTIAAWSMPRPGSTATRSSA